VEAASLQGDGKTARIESSRLSLGSERFRLSGRVTAAGSGPYEADLALSADEVDAKALAQETEAETRPPASGGKGKPSFLQWLWDAPVRGAMKVDLARLRYGRLSIAPFQAEVSLAAGRLSADASRLGVCGISLPGRLEATRDGASFQLKAAAKGADLARTLPCLGHAAGVITGSFDLTADLSAKGTLDRPRSLLDSLRGDLTFKAKDGRIFRMGILAKIFAVLNVTEVFRGRMPDLFETGFGYRSIKTKGGIEDGKLVFEEGTLDGASATLFWDGRVNLSTRDTDLTVVVAPLKTVDAIISRIPVVNYLLDRTLLSIPVRVTGDIADPDIVPLAPTAVGRRLLGFMERTLLLPYKVIQPLLPKGDGEKAP
jgi:uncharacterized protein YhdP